MNTSFFRRFLNRWLKWNRGVTAPVSFEPVIEKRNLIGEEWLAVLNRMDKVERKVPEKHVETIRAEDTKPGVHQGWLNKHGLKENEQGMFPVDSFQGKTSVTTEKMFDNIRINASKGYDPLETSPYDDRIFVMVCGGPSLEDHLEEIRKKASHPEHYLIVCSNMTAGYLISRGIIPHVHFIIDCQEHKKNDVRPGCTSTMTDYWINAGCHPSVFESLVEQGIRPKIFLADFESEGKAFQLMQEEMRKVKGFRGCLGIQGGTMAGLRAMNLADCQGFRRMQYYGFDAVVKVKDGVPYHYAYNKHRGETVIEVQCDRCEEKFTTTLVFQRQVNEFIQWQANMPWIDISIIGGGLISHYNDHIKALKQPRATHRFTPEYLELQKKMHEAGNYGTSGVTYSTAIFHAISQIAKRFHGRVEVLDYGSSSGRTTNYVRASFYLPPDVQFYNYDPAVEKFAGEPKPADLVICTDVMEHVEPECTWAVLDHIQKLTKRVVFFSIDLTPAEKVMEDGRNAHINLRTNEFWLKEIQKRFVISEAQMSKDGHTLLVIGQAVSDVRRIIKEVNIEKIRRERERKNASHDQEGKGRVQGEHPAQDHGEKNQHPEGEEAKAAA